MQDTGGDVPLTDLCTICHANPIKYTCPRCGVHTCSLPCVKRHKSWAQCSGVRNPAAYRPRSELATPSSVDQDFNFISSLERSLSRADDLVTDRGIILAPSGTKRQDFKRKLDIEIQERQISVIKAPQGLSRSKQNKSHWAGQHGCIMWTTEWLCYNGATRIVNVLESKTIGDIFTMQFGRKLAQRKRKRSDAQKKEQNFETNNVPTTQNDNTEGAIDPIPATKNDEASPLRPSRKSFPISTNDGTKLENETSHDLIPDTANTIDNPSATPRNTNEPIDLDPDLHFYILKPNTPAKYKCLIPISTSSTLGDILRGKTILEFPTFHVKKEPPDELPAPFITEQQYTEIHDSEVPVVIDTLPVYHNQQQLHTDGKHPPSALDDVDERKVLEVLQKDLTN